MIFLIFQTKVRNHSQFITTCFFLFLLSGNSVGATYYIKSGGNDASDGLSIATAWKTLEPVNAKNFIPGDKILLEGGSTFTGYIYLDPADSGSPSNPIVISSYGNGKATINSGNSLGIYVYNTSGVQITNLKIKGSGSSTNQENGLKFFTDLAGVRLDYIFVNDVEVYGYAKSGILIGAEKVDCGFRNVTIINSLVHDNGETGIFSFGDSLNLNKYYAHHNIYVANNKVYNTSGQSNLIWFHTGSGIALSSVNGATIEYNEVYNNGALNTSPHGGPVGIWVYNANDVYIQYNESHHNKAGFDRDGGGFDLDGGTTNSYIQYNYSHDNEGAGYMVAQFKGAQPLKNNVIRYNISQNDGRKNGYPSILLWSSPTNDGIQNLEIYNNTVYLNKPSSGNPKIIWIDGPMSGIEFKNNIFYSTDYIYSIVSTVSTGLKFQGNCYYSTVQLGIWWKGTNYYSLNAWRSATNQETNGTASTGFETDPQFNSPGGGGTIGNPANLKNLSVYKLKSSSPLLNKGLPISNSGQIDYSGYFINQGSGPEPGSNEFPVSGSNTKPFIFLSSPANQSSFAKGSTLLIYANATSGDASISKVEFYNGSSLLGTSTSWPYKYTWNNVAAGNYTLLAKAYNNSGTTSNSNQVTILVKSSQSASDGNFRTPENPANTNNGLDFNYYEGTWTSLPDFTKLTPVKSGQTSQFDLLHKNKNDFFGFQFTGYIGIPTDGIYTFYTSSNDGSKLYIGNTEVVNNDGIHGTSEKSGTIGLKAGKHAIRVVYFENNDAENLTIYYMGPDLSKRVVPSSALFRISETQTTCTASGTILREVWNGLSGDVITDLTNASNYPDNPASKSNITSFEGPVNTGDKYGARYHGYICAPETGYYLFYIASDNNSELWLSYSDNPDGVKKIAFVEGYTGSREWKKYPSQTSIPIYLHKSERYYVEVLHKEGSGEDNLAVGWLLPSGKSEMPIPGSRLSPFTNEQVNKPPTVNITSPSNGQNYIAPATIAISASANDSDGQITKVEFFQNNNKIGEDLSAPYSYNWSQVGKGNYSLVVKATDNNGAVTTSNAISVSVGDQPTSNCTTEGKILRQYWLNCTGSSVSNIPLSSSPSGSEFVNSFEGPVNWDNNYGSKISGYICAPVTGNYFFWIASNDGGELWLSTDGNPATKSKIAYVPTYTNPQQWDKFSTQKSASITLIQGQKYYIEALQKEGLNNDHLSVGWQLPNGVLERPIPGTRLSPDGSSGGGSSPPSQEHCTAEGKILREYWMGISGTSVGSIPFHTPPGGSEMVSLFEGPQNWADNYGTRIRGLICAPETGNYVFWLACNDEGELWLSSNEDPQNKVKIAFVSTYTNYRQWDKLSSQQTSAIPLEKGKQYYIEALQKEGVKSDHISVGWQLPGGTLERPISGIHLSPATLPFKIAAEEFPLESPSDSDLNLIVYPNPVEEGIFTLSIEGYTGKTKADISMYDLQGSKIFTDKVSCDLTCDRTHVNLNHRFPKGAYLIKVEINKEIFTQKLIVK